MSLARNEVAEARAGVYYALADALVEPAPGLRDLLISAAQGGARGLTSTACGQAAQALAALAPASETELRKQYARVMAPPGQRPPALYESLHRDGRLMGETALEVEQQYRRLGVAPVQGELPDHASVELAFLGSLTMAEAEIGDSRDAKLLARLRHERRAFLRKHAGVWLPELGAALAVAGEPFYRVVGGWLRAFLHEEMASRRQRVQRLRALPALTDHAACTLCGLCTGRCTTGALQISEDTGETRLVLLEARCTGCSLCTAICPQAVLTMAVDYSSSKDVQPASSADQETGAQILRRSARLACPQCGRPTVSQAELDGVFARLQLGAEMEQRLRLCVMCKVLYA